jgi:hypothetical protein
MQCTECCCWCVRLICIVGTGKCHLLQSLTCQRLPLLPGFCRSCKALLEPSCRRWRVGGVGVWVEICKIAGGVGEDGLSFVGSVQQCRFGGRAVGMDGAWLTPSAAGAYPHRTYRTWLDTCATKNGAGVRAARDHNDWRSTTWPEANQYRVNSSPWYCNKCRKKIQERLDALHPDGNEGTVTVESGQGEGDLVELQQTGKS